MMDPQESVIKQSEKRIHEDPIDERSGYADRADGSLRSKLGAHGLKGHFHDLLDAHATEGRVLDIACGRAEYADERLDDPSVEWYGIDLSEQRIRDATDRVDDPNASFVVGDAEYLPFASDQFDTVVSGAALHHLPNWDGRALDEIQRVMADDGVLIFMEPLKYNPLAYTFRRVSPGPRHTPHEHPFPYRTFKTTLAGRFEEVDVRAHNVVCLVFPLLSGVAGIRLPWPAAKATYDFEQRVLKGSLKGMGMHMTGIAKHPV